MLPLGRIINNVDFMLNDKLGRRTNIFRPLSV